MVNSPDEMMVDPDGAAFSEGSPARCLLGRIADKWAVLIMGILLRRPFHFLELHREVGGVSRKVLPINFANSRETAWFRGVRMRTHLAYAIR